MSRTTDYLKPPGQRLAASLLNIGRDASPTDRHVSHVAALQVCIREARVQVAVQAVDLASSMTRQQKEILVTDYGGSPSST